jgi:cytochrome b6-f complex iron-sulfur subunit
MTPETVASGRRRFLTRVAWALVHSSVAASVVGMFRLLFPRVRFTPATVVALGKPSEFPVGTISEKWKKSHRVILVRSPEGFHALHSRCTHLGCIPAWSAAQRKFKCPCHGSGFRLEGDNFEGPAPRPLERLRIFMDEEGRVAVDTAVVLRKERGEWAHPDAFLAYRAQDERGHGKA